MTFSASVLAVALATLSPVLAADGEAEGQVLYNAVTMLCAEADKGKLSFNDSAALARHGFAPAPDADEQNNYLAGVKGEIVTRKIGGTSFRVSHYAPASCLTYIQGPKIESAWAWTKQRLLASHGYSVKSENKGTTGTTETLERPLETGGFARITFNNSSGPMPIANVFVRIDEK